jgi:transcriptional regulator with PAS, ATPase and Fis domain
LLEGETGTGKTVAARAIHAASARASRPFVVIDCGALPPTLLESELFGHERGAFTGADTPRVGGFEAADGGTVFLDEIGEMPVELQPKLLGAIEGRTIRRLGGNVQRPIDVRIIAATNRDLRTEVNAARFRSDLYYRLAVLTIRTPALRERAADIERLSAHILGTLGATAAQAGQILTPECLARMRREAWPGNTRQLRNYLERCLVLEDVVPMPDASPAPSSTATIRVDTHAIYADARRQAIGEFERIYLRDALRRHDRVPDAAAEAGLERTYFYRLLRRHGINHD